MFLGMFAGMLQLMLGRIPVTLGMGGGILVFGLLAGWLHSRVPRIGAIPASSVWLLQHLGIGLFIAVVGISSSAGFFIGLKEKGFQLFLAGVVVSLVPTILGLLLGRFVFKFHPVITLGATWPYPNDYFATVPEYTLNVATAGGVILYELVRRRRYATS